MFRWLRIIVLLTLALVGASRAASSCPSIKPRFPSVLTYASLNGIAPPETDGEWWFDVKHLDMANGDPPDLVEFKKRDPGFFMVKYRLLESALLGDPEGRALDAFCRSRSLDPEEAYLHYSDDTRIRVEGKVYLNKGWGKGTAANKRESRIRAHVWNSWRFVYNPHDRCTREFMTDRSVKDITENIKGFHYDGVFIDEVNPPDWPEEMPVPPSVISGGHTLEYGGQTKEQVAKSGEYMRDLTALFAEISAAMKAASHGRSLFYPNTSGYTTESVVRLGLAADGLLTEGLSVEGAAYSDRGETLLWDVARRLAAHGKIYILAQASSDPPQEKNFNASNYRSPQDRHEMYSLASYWMARHDDCTYYSQRYRWQQLSSSWIKAQEYDIGQPVGDYYLWKENNSVGDSAGQKYRIYRRDYSKAIVLFRTRYDWSEVNNKDFGAKSDSYELGGAYRLLYPNGKLGPPVTRIALSLGEGVVLIPEARRLRGLEGDRRSQSSSARSR